MKLYFPDVQIEKFDFDEDWLIRSINPSTIKSSMKAWVKIRI